MSKLKISFNMIAAGLAALVLVAACTQSKPPHEFTVRIGLFPVLDTLPYYVMKEQGFAKKNGLLFVEIRYPGGAAIIDAMATGKADVGVTIGTVPVLSAAERGHDPRQDHSRCRQ